MTSELEQSGIRTVLVRPENDDQETYAVIQGTLVLVISSILIAGALRGPQKDSQSIASYQKLFQEQSPPLQRTYRELVSGLEDALRLRTPHGGWPSAQTLRDELVPPFVGADADYQWELRGKGEVLNYLGHPIPGSTKPVFLLLIQQNLQHPGMTVLDEFHRKCPDGTLLHVGVWVHPTPNLGSGVVVVPAREGWTEIVSGSAAPEDK